MGIIENLADRIRKIQAQKQRDRVASGQVAYVRQEERTRELDSFRNQVGLIAGITFQVFNEINRGALGKRASINKGEIIFRPAFSSSGGPQLHAPSTHYPDQYWTNVSMVTTYDDPSFAITSPITSDKPGLTSSLIERYRFYNERDRQDFVKGKRNPTNQLSGERYLIYTETSTDLITETNKGVCKVVDIGDFASVLKADMADMVLDFYRR